ncbi:glycogen synthase [Desulfosarcina ovata]|uniref:Glycogen synthase n=1 Tax=Desulfosarcina ovata subsp. ovata TaxID=2752305 RepID=A0A5K8AFT0_9BACT|nr:glycogen synthase [Desulfosarcina ovata]BBO91379.1 glycogen synthase [Desulfosarcina ovata subsp. ovata]
MKILFVSPEIAPYAKTGGLADVAKALPEALSSMGHDIRTIMPKYLSIVQQNLVMAQVTDFTVQTHHGLHGSVLWQTENDGIPTYFVENEAFFNREGLYGLGDWNYPDNLERFVFFCKAVLAGCKAIDFLPDVIHCNDWQTAALPAILKAITAGYCQDPFFQPVPKVVYTIHNISYQGRFPEDHWPILSLPRGYYTNDFEFFGQINLTKGAIHLSDTVTTVSETYAKEIEETDFGFGLQDILQRNSGKLVGILNGVDYRSWSPDVDPYTYGIHYSTDDRSGKYQIKTRLREEYGLPDRVDVPLIGVISRLVEQKGIDLIRACAEQILQLDTQMIVLGSGDPTYHAFFEWLLHSYPDRVGIYIGFNNALAHRIEAGADMFLMPSLFEPCGLNQIYSLRYGTLPIVRQTGGLADSIQDGVNGFTFFDFNAHFFFDAAKRAVDVYRNRPEKWEEMMATAMAQDFSWNRSADKYITVYRQLLEAPNE